MKEGSGDAGGDRNEFALAVKDFDVAGGGEFGEVDGAPAADAGGGGFIGGDGGKLGQQPARMNEKFVDCVGFHCGVMGGRRVSVVER